MMMLGIILNHINYVNTSSFLDDCQWNDWEDTSVCSKTCGFGAKTGTKSQRRTKKTKKQYDGKCDNVFTRKVACTTHSHCPGT